MREVDVLHAFMTDPRTKLFRDGPLVTRQPQFGKHKTRTWLLLELFGSAHTPSYPECELVAQWLGTPLPFGK